MKILAQNYQFKFHEFLLGNGLYDAQKFRDRNKNISTNFEKQIFEKRFDRKWSDLPKIFLTKSLPNFE
jgi:hypothetical protein